MKALNLSTERADELKQVVSFLETNGDEVESLLSSSELMFEFDEIVSSLAEHFDDEIANLTTLHLASVAMLADKPGRELSDVISALRTGLRASGWNDEQIAKFDSVSEILCRLASNRALFVGAKASSIVRQSGSHIHNVRSVVDARPIFDLDRGKIEATVLITNLCFTISNANEVEEQINLTLDEEDLTKIRDECDNAIDKLEKLRDNLASGEIGKVVIYGRRVG